MQLLHQQRRGHAMSTIERLAEKHGGTFGQGAVKLYIFDQVAIAALIADVRQQAMEEAAGVCDRVAFDYDEQSAPHHMGGANTCAAAIRARLEEGK
jgi:hypothetical protein